MLNRRLPGVYGRGTSTWLYVRGLVGDLMTEPPRFRSRGTEAPFDRSDLWSLVPLGVQLAKPTQRSQSRHKAVFTAARHDKLRNALKPFAEGFARQGKVGAIRVGANNRILIVAGANEDSVVNPLRLDELKLPSQVCSDECEDQAPVSAVVVAYAGGGAAFGCQRGQ